MPEMATKTQFKQVESTLLKNEFFYRHKANIEKVWQD